MCDSACVNKAVVNAAKAFNCCLQWCQYSILVSETQEELQRVQQYLNVDQFDIRVIIPILNSEKLPQQKHSRTEYDVMDSHVDLNQNISTLNADVIDLACRKSLPVHAESVDVSCHFCTTVLQIGV